jgi:hypothetical protein
MAWFKGLFKGLVRALFAMPYFSIQARVSSKTRVLA